MVRNSYVHCGAAILLINFHRVTEVVFISENPNPENTLTILYHTKQESSTQPKQESLTRPIKMESSTLINPLPIRVFTPIPNYHQALITAHNPFDLVAKSTF